MELDLKLPQQQLLEKASTSFFEKGGKPAIIGEVRTHSGRDYMKTEIGWKIKPKTQDSAESIEKQDKPIYGEAESIELKRKHHIEHPEHKKSSAQDTTSKVDKLIGSIQSAVTNNHNLIAYGKGQSVEKAHALMEALKDKKEYIADNKNYDYVKLTSVNLESLHKAMQEHNGKLLILPHADSALKNEKTVELITSALRGERLYSLDEVKDEDSNVGFSFNGKLVITSNLSYKDVPAKIKAHAITIDMSFDSK